MNFFIYISFAICNGLVDFLPKGLAQQIKAKQDKELAKDLDVRMNGNAKDPSDNGFEKLKSNSAMNDNYGFHNNDRAAMKDPNIAERNDDSNKIQKLLDKNLAPGQSSMAPLKSFPKSEVFMPTNLTNPLPPLTMAQRIANSYAEVAGF